MSGRRTAFLLGLVAVEAGAAAGASLAGNAATGQGRWPGVLDLLRQYPWPAFGGFTLLLLVAGAVGAVSEGGGSAGPGEPPPPAAPPVPGWVVDRSEAEQVVSAVCRRGRRAVGITSTTGLHGAGGFGKTTLAEVVWAHPRVRRRFRGRIYRVTVGRDVRSPAAIAAKVTEATRFITGDSTPFDDPDLAGAHLGRLLDLRPPTLLILDDIWFRDQLTPFLSGGEECVRLVTTRVPDLLPSDAERVLVDQMSPQQARHLLTWELPPWPAEITEGLLRATGRWPLLLRLAHETIKEQVDTGAAPAVAAAGVLEQLRRDGPTAIDPDTATVDLSDPRQRKTAVQAAIDAAAQLLPTGGYDRFTELGIFTEDESIPIALIAALWQATGSLTLEESRRLCGALGKVSLLSLDPDPQTGGRIQLHDVIRDYLRAQLGQTRLQQINAALVDAAAATLPAAPPEPGADPAVGRAWWQMDDGYLADHLITHLLDAGHQAQAEAVATDLRWIEWRLRSRGTTAPWTDLTALQTPTARAAADAFARTAHLLAPTDPEHALSAVLRSRLGAYDPWQHQAGSWRSAHPTLRNRWPLPDLPDPALRRTLTGHSGPVTAVAISPDGTRLITGGADRALRIWDTTTGTTMRTLTGHTGAVNAVAVSPDGAWFATTSTDGTVRIRDTTIRTTTMRTLTGHSGPVTAVAISPDGTRLITGGADGAVRIWDTTIRTTIDYLPGGGTATTSGTPRTVTNRTLTGTSMRILTGHTGSVEAVAVSPDGAWLATAGTDWTVRIWDTGTGTMMRTLTDHTGSVEAVAISPDGAWLATSGDDGTVRIWDTDTGTTRTQTGHTGSVEAVAVSPDGAWLATASNDGTVRIWGTTTATVVHTLTGHTGPVNAVAVSPDGAWLATASNDGTVQIWDTTTATTMHTLTSHRWVGSVAISPDGTWLITGEAGAVRIWDTRTGTMMRTLTGHSAPVNAVAISPDGAWFATVSTDGAVRTWGTTTGTMMRTLTGHSAPVNAVAISPDGAWLATASNDGTVRIWDTGTGTTMRILTGHTGSVEAVAVSPDGAWLATASNDGTVRIWDTTRWSATQMRVDGTLSSCCWLPDGASVAASGAAGVYLFTFDSGTNLPR